MKKFCIILTVFAFLASLAAISLYAYASTRSVTASGEENLNFLLLGSDQASGNTDVMILFGYSPSEKKLTLMQIPRDTYYDLNGQGVKINHLYPLAKEKGKDPKNAISFVADALSSALSIPIHGVALIRLEALAAFVDTIGGIPMNVPSPMQYRDDAQGLLINIPAGERILSGKEAVHFVRFRSDYLAGDIGRLDAQKIFLAALYKKISQTPNAVLTALSFLQDGSTVLSLEGGVSLPAVLSRAYLDRGSLSLYFLSMPGEACFSDGLSYYTPNKGALCRVLSDHFSHSALSPDALDPNRVLCKQSDPEMVKIYQKQDHSYKIYTQDEVNDIIITKKE